MAKSNPHKDRGYCITINNWKEKDVENLKQLKYKFLVIGSEVAPSTGTPHLQVYVYMKNQITFSAICKKLKGAHVEDQKAYDCNKAADYCKKESVIFTDGELPKQGQRTDLEEVTDQIKEGIYTTDDIAMINPSLFHQYGRTMERIEAITLRRKFRTEMTKGFWYYGPTGVGKSHKVFEDYNPLKVYVKNMNDEWWDGYTGQEIVIFNEFRGELRFSELLDLVDKWPKTVKQRCKEPVPFLAKEVRITSALPPGAVYCNKLQEQDSMEQFDRRFTVIELASQKCSEGNSITSEQKTSPDAGEKKLTSEFYWGCKNEPCTLTRGFDKCYNGHCRCRGD